MTTISRNCAHRYSSQNCNLSIISSSLSNSSFCYENTPLTLSKVIFNFQSRNDKIVKKRLTYPWKSSKLKIFNRKNVLHRDTFPLRMMLGLLIFKRVAAVYRTKSVKSAKKVKASHIPISLFYTTPSIEPFTQNSL